MASQVYHSVVIGAGLVGLSVAYHLKLKSPGSKILLLEKEADVAKHQSGHNSGVIHSGIYYKPGSLKAKNCIEGYNSLLEFAQIHDIPHEICGKLIIATSKDELSKLHEIYKRGIENGLTNLKLLNSQEEIHESEPHCFGISGIMVPQTGIIDYPKVAETLLQLYKNEYEGEAIFGQKVIKITKQNKLIHIETDKQSFVTKNVISCAGLYSDKLSGLTEIENDLRIIPFRGEYYKLREEKNYLVKNLIYPVPDPNFPFLGVHFTRMIGGGVEAGPNAVLAFKREGYNFVDFNLKELGQSLIWPGFWKIVGKYGKTGLGEMYRSLSKSAFTKSLQKLVPEIQKSDLIAGGAGVRAQACSRDGILIDDFDILKRANIVHVRNAPSPAATSSLSIGKYICNHIQN